PANQHGRRARGRHRARDATRQDPRSRRPPHLSARRGGRHTRSGGHLPQRAWSPGPSALTLAPRVGGVGLSTANTARQVSWVPDLGDLRFARSRALDEADAAEDRQHARATTICFPSSIDDPLLTGSWPRLETG